MPRKKSQQHLDLMPKNKTTQYNAYAKVQYTVGIQTSFEQTLKSFDLTKAVQTDLETTSDKVSRTVNVETQTEIFGFIVPSYNWNEINSLVKLKALKRKSEDREEEVNSKKCRQFIGDNETPAKLSVTLPISKRIINEALPSPLAALLPYLETLHEEGISIKHSKNQNGLLEQFEVSKANGLIGVGDYYDTPIKLLFDSTGKLTVLVLFKSAEKFEYFVSHTKTLNMDIIASNLELLSESQVFCSGLSKNECEGMESTKNLLKFTIPFERYQSNECLVWFSPPPNANKDKIESKLYQCRKCQNLNWYLTRCKKKQATLTPKMKRKRQLVASSCRIGILAPKSRQYRIRQIRNHRSFLTRKNKELEQKIKVTNPQLSDDQDKKNDKSCCRD